MGQLKPERTNAGELVAYPTKSLDSEATHLANRRPNVVYLSVMSEQSRCRPIAAPTGRYDLADWPVDVQRTDASGEIDLGQLDFNLSLTPRQRIEQNDAWVSFIQLARQAGRGLHAKRSPT
jgi:hypothetical protein